MTRDINAAMLLAQRFFSAWHSTHLNVLDILEPSNISDQKKKKKSQQPCVSFLNVCPHFNRFQSLFHQDNSYHKSNWRSKHTPS